MLSAYVLVGELLASLSWLFGQDRVFVAGRDPDIGRGAVGASRRKPTSEPNAVIQSNNESGDGLSPAALRSVDLRLRKQYLPDAFVP
jgi:hypothetical protein